MTTALQSLTERIDRGAAGGLEFERLMHQLILRYGDSSGFTYKPVNGAGGDDGVDGWVERGLPGLEGRVAFQFKWLWENIHEGKKAAKIKDALKRAAKLRRRVKHWILVTPWDLKPSEQEWLSKLPVRAGITVHHWGQTRIEGLLRSAPSLLARYYPHEARSYLNGFSGFDFKEFAASYRQKMAEAYRHLRTLGLPPETLRERDARADVPLRDLFVPLRFLGEDDRAARQSLSQLLEARHSAVVLGDPGAGKSTLLAFISLLLSGEADLEGFTPAPGVVPLFISLRQYVRAKEQDAGLSFRDYLVQYVRSDLNLSEAHPAFFDATLKMGEAVVLFDGLDEVGSTAARHRIAGMIKTFRAEYPACPVWVTSRIYGYTQDIRLPKERFHHVRLGRLEDSQINEFIRRWYTIQIPHNEREREEFTSSLSKAVQRTPSVRRLAGNPLLLTLMAFIHQGLRKLPQDRGELYEKCVEMLLKTWQEAKREGEQEKNHPFEKLGLHIQTQKDYLAHLALQAQEHNQEGDDENARGLISRKDALECLTERHLTLGRRERPSLTTGQALDEMKSFLDYISDQTGLLIDRGGDQLSFIHLSFQEYLAAWVFTCEPGGNNNPAFFTKHLGRPAWEEVLLLRLYIVLRTPGGGGPTSFDAIVGAVLRQLEQGGPPQGWLTLTRALRDNLDFTPSNRDAILRKAIEAWATSPAYAGDWFPALEEVVLFTEKAKTRIAELLDEDWQREPPARAIACLHLRTKLFGFPSNAVEGLSKHPEIKKMLPDLFAFLDEPAMADFLSETASFSDWEAAFIGLDNRRLYLLSLEWGIGAKETLPLKPHTVRATAAALRHKIINDLRSRKDFTTKYQDNPLASQLSRLGRIHEEHGLFSIELPLSVGVCGTVSPALHSVPAQLPLRPTLAHARFEEKEWAAPLSEAALSAWANTFANAHLQRFQSLTTPTSDLQEVAGLLSADFGRDFIRNFARIFSSNFIHSYTQDFGHDLLGGLIPDFTQDINNNHSHVIIRTITRALTLSPFQDPDPKVIQVLGREFGHEFGQFLRRSIVRSFFRVASQNTAYNTVLIRTLAHDFEIDFAHQDWERQWEQALSNEKQRERLLARSFRWLQISDWSNTITIKPDTNIRSATAHLKNPLAFSLLLNSLFIACLANLTLSLGRHLDTTISKNEPLESLKAAAVDWLRRNPLDAYAVALSWEEHARLFAAHHGRLAGPQGELALTHAAYATLITGLPCSGPTWSQLLDERDREDPAICASFLLHEVCHSRDVEQNVYAFDALTFESKKPLSPQPEISAFTTQHVYAPASSPLPMHSPAKNSGSNHLPEPLFSWIHLSDIHVGHGGAGHQWDQKLVLSSLQRDITEQQARGVPRPDAILVTGDIAFSGEVDQYTEAKRWLLDIAETVGLGTQQVFTVPGNHDVLRAVDKDRNIARMVRALREGADDLDEVLANEADRHQLARRMENYLSFAAGFAPACMPTAQHSLASWVHQYEARHGLRIRLVGLNTALLSADTPDKGRLRLGKQPLGNTLASALPADNELVLVLSHHPFQDGWLADQREVGAWIRARAHVHLSGHVHEPDLEESRAGSGNTLVRIVAGAVHGERAPLGVPAGHGYSFGAVYPQSGGGLVLRVWPRIWSENNKDFRSDVHNIPRGSQYAEHSLPAIRLSTAG